MIFVYQKMPELTGHSLEAIESRRADGTFKSSDFATT